MGASMRRQDIQLRALARQGDPSACCEIGRRYLLGVDGFARHVTSGLGYLGRRLAGRLVRVWTDELAELTASAVAIAEARDVALDGIEPTMIETCLDIRARRGDADAAYALGRALCGIDVGRLGCESLTTTV